MVGLPDAKLGEAVLAWIRLKPGESSTEAEIQEFCQGRILTLSGKVQKFVIR